MRAEIIAVGSELLTPDRLDTNSLFLTEQLNRLGIEIVRKTIVGDVPSQVHGAFREALGRVDLVISSGGLGPTEDDLTREAVADLLGRKLIPNDTILHEIEARFRKIGRNMPEVNVRQAMVPEGATVLANPKGTAPGLWLETNGRIIILLPGPPGELMAMFTDQVQPRLDHAKHPLRLFHRELRVVGMGESDLEQRILPIYKRYDKEVHTTILASPGEIQVHLRAWSTDPAGIEKLLQEIVEGFQLALGENIFSLAGETLDEVVARALQLNHATVAVAESCTGGLIAGRLTSVAGSSSYFLGGVVCYSNELKAAWADVPAQLIAAKGAVSADVAIALAEGIRNRVGSELGVGVTGVAGPAGGSEEKPVGTVHIALAHSGGTRERALRLTGDRERIRWQASQFTLDMLRRHFLFTGQNSKAAKG
jgi:nicotinamide-nucleotide amidase